MSKIDSFENCRFAGFDLPRRTNYPTVCGLSKPLASRLAEFKGYKAGKRKVIGATTYPNRIRTNKTERHFLGWGIYMDNETSLMGLRYAWVDEVPNDWDEENPVPNIRHCGWFLDAHECDVIHGLVLKLPGRRGFLAGCSLGAGMASSVDKNVFEDITAAVYAADDMAREMAEAEWRYRREQLAA